MLPTPLAELSLQESVSPTIGIIKRKDEQKQLRITRHALQANRKLRRH